MMRSVSRRSSDKVKTEIVRAAADEFSAHGYAGATMRGVAASAGVSLSVLHRHYASKQELFSAALVTPFLRFFEDFASAWVEHVEDPWDERTLVHEFVRRLYRALRASRLTLVDLLAVSEADSEILREVRTGLDEIRTRLRSLEDQDARTRGSGLSHDVVPHANRMIVALVTGLVVLHPFLSESADEDDDLIEVATDVLLNGLRRSQET